MTAIPRTAAQTYFIVPAPGHYGDSCHVLSSHRTLAAARRAAGPGYVVRVGQMAAGDEWLRAWESLHPEASIIDVEEL